MSVSLRKATTRLLLAVSLLAGCAVLAGAVVFFEPQLLIPLVERLLAPAGGTATVAGLELRLLPLSVEADGISIAGLAGGADSLRVGRAELVVNAGGLFGARGKLALKSLSLEGVEARLALPTGAGGGTSGPGLPAGLPDIGELRVRDAKLTLVLPEGEITVERLDAAVLPEETQGRRIDVGGAVWFEGEGIRLPPASLSGGGTIAPNAALTFRLGLSPLAVSYGPVVGTVSGSLNARLNPQRAGRGDLKLVFDPSGEAVPRAAKTRLGPSRLDLSCASGPGGAGWEVTVGELSLGDALAARGGFAGPALDSLEGRLSGRLPRTEVAMALAEALFGATPPWALEGELPFTLTLNEGETGPAVELQVEPRGLEARWQAGGLTAVLSGKAAAAGGIGIWRQGSPALEGRIDLHGGAGKAPWSVASAHASVVLGGTLRRPRSPSTRLEVPPGGVRHGEEALPLGEVRGEAAWEVPEGGGLRVGDLRASSPALGLWQGAGEIGSGGLTGTLTGTGVEAKAAVATARLLSVPHANDLTALGTAQVSLKLSRDMKDQGSHLEATLSARQLEVRWKPEELAGEVSGKVTIRGSTGGHWPAEASLAGKVAVAGGSATWGGWEIRDLGASLPLAGSPGAPASPGWTLELPPKAVRFRGTAIPLGALSARGRGALSGAGSGEVEVTELQGGELGAWKGSARWEPGGAQGAAQGKAVDLQGALQVLGSLIPDLAGWSAEGGADLSARGTWNGGHGALDGEAIVRKAGFTSPDGDLLSQGLGGTLRVSLGGPEGRSGSIALTAGQGGLLWKTVYLDFASSPLALNGQGTARPKGGFRDLDTEVKLGGFGALRFRGSLAREGGAWRPAGRVTLDSAQLGPIFDAFVKEPLGASYPAVADLQVDGTASLDLELGPRQGGTGITGRVRVEGARVARGIEEPLVSGLALDLPVSYVLGREEEAAPAAPTAADWGALAWGRLQVAGVDVAPLRLPVALVPNRLLVQGKIPLVLPGGVAVLQDIRVEEPLSTEVQALLGVEMKDLDIRALAGAALPLEGHLAGSLEPVRITLQELDSGGQLRGELFGGALEVGGISVRQPLSPGREFGADITATSMDLEKLSAALDFGRITGRLDVWLKGLRVAYGQPVAFHLRAESVPTKGVSQRVSLKAVNAISLLGTGSGLGGAGLSLLTSFFKEFPYQKIGFECDLRNDVFRIQGLIHEDGVEYLVKRPFFGGINVINRNPNNTIRFSDMLRRLERLSQPAGG